MKSQEQILIEQLPSDHPERNKWLEINGIGEEVENLKVKTILSDTSTSLAEKCNEIMNLFRPKVTDGRPPAMPRQAPIYQTPHSPRF